MKKSILFLLCIVKLTYLKKKLLQFILSFEINNIIITLIIKS